MAHCLDMADEPGTTLQYECTPFGYVNLWSLSVPFPLSILCQNDCREREDEIDLFKGITQHLKQNAVTRSAYTVHMH